MGGRGYRKKRTFVILPLLDILKVVDPGVVVILSRKHKIIHVAGMGVGDGMA